MAVSVSNVIKYVLCTMAIVTSCLGMDEPVHVEHFSANGDPVLLQVPWGGFVTQDQWERLYHCKYNSPKGQVLAARIVTMINGARAQERKDLSEK